MSKFTGKIMPIGVDVGNSDTKSQHTSTPSGYKSQPMRPRMAAEWILYEGKYYVPTDERFPYSMDKTENGHALILSLFGIAKELLWEIKEEQCSNPNSGTEQELADTIKQLSLGIGLPPGHFDALATKTDKYYRDQFADGVTFTYYCSPQDKRKASEVEFHLTMVNVRVFPQDFLAVWKNEECKISNDSDKYIIIGIGGYTVDIIPVKDNRVQSDLCTSLPLGTTVMYQNTIREVLKAGVRATPDGIERVLRGKSHIFDEEIVEIIKQNAAQHVEIIIDSCLNANFSFDETPVVYFGGGCILLKEYLEKNSNIKHFEFYENINGNAVAFAKHCPRK